LSHCGKIYRKVDGGYFQDLSCTPPDVHS
jgi:hypothetical protein